MNNELWGQHGLAFGEGPLHRDHVCFRVMNGDTGESGGYNLPLIDKVEFAPMHPPKEGKHETVAVPNIFLLKRVAWCVLVDPLVPFMYHLWVDHLK